MTEAYEGTGDMFDPRFAELVGAEFSEDDQQLKFLLEHLHYMHADLLSDDQASDATIEGRRGIAQPTPVRYVYRDNDPNVAPVAYDETEWRPKPHATNIGVYHTYVRYPVLRGTDIGLPNPEDVHAPNDVLVEIVYKNGENHRYLVNDHGVASYASGENLDYDGSELEDPTRHSTALPNVFKVAVDHWYSPPMTAQMLVDLIIRDSGYDRHPKRPSS